MLAAKWRLSRGWEGCQLPLVALAGVASALRRAGLHQLRGLASGGPGGAADLKPWAAAGKPLEQAATIPSSWYTDPRVLALELERVFKPAWQVLGYTGRLAAAGDYLTGDLVPGAPFLACRDQQGELRAFHNVCRHHAAAVAAGSGRGSVAFRCPYHGWTYGLDGRLQKAVGLKGIEGFRAAENGLVPLAAAALGPWLFGSLAAASAISQPPGASADASLLAWLGEHGAFALQASGACRPGLVHVASREYSLRCNWKIFADNYLDGGYHVSIAHPVLAAGLDLDSYTSRIYERLSIQSCRPRGGDARLAGELEAAYVFVYPNLMINSYGPWIDTNLVLPTGPDSCQVLFEYYLEPELAAEEGFVSASLAASEQVQREDIALCEGVQRGLASPAYDVGRYAPRFEAPMHHFHQLLHRDLAGDEGGGSGGGGGGGGSSAVPLKA